MAKISGVFRGGDEPLQLVLIHLDADDPDDRTWPGRKRSFGHACLVTGYTDETGRYDFEYPDVSDRDQDLLVRGRVVLQVFADGRLRWQSPIGPWDPDMVIGGELEPPVPPPPPPPRTYTVQGHITTCGQPADGYVVSAYEVTQTGLASGSSPCVLGGPNVRLVGTSTLDQDGRYVVSYQPSRAPLSSCSFVASIFVEVSQASGIVDWTSDEVKRRPSITFDHDLLRECDPNSTLIRVVNQFGQSVSGAEVTTVDAKLGTTNSAGYLAVTGLATGQRIAARKLLVEHETARRGHKSSANSKNWNFRSYFTSVGLAHDAQGNGVSLGVDTVTANEPVQELRLLPTNTLVGFNLKVSVEWDASQSQLVAYRDRFLETSELLYNATDGQFCIERVSIVDNASEWDSADVRIHASINQKSFATLNGVQGSSGRITMNPIDSFFPGTLLHELGHYLFGVRDEYKEGARWDPNNGPVRCTLASTSSIPEFAEGGSKDSCLMRGNRFQAMKKFCSSHPSNPHVDGTAQGATDCWTGILEKFGPAGVGLPNATFWQPRGPVQRLAIVDRLPDSGTSMGTVTSAAPGAVDPLSFIPFKSWKPSWHTGSVEKPGECPNLIVKAVHDGLAFGNAAVQLRTADGRTIFQGRTRTTSGQLGDGSFLAEGELSIRGAHIGDRIVTQHLSQGGQVIQGNGEVTDCGTLLEIATSSFTWPWTMSASFDDTRNLVISVVDALAAPLMRVGIDGTDEPASVHLVRRDRALEGTVRGRHGDQQYEVDALFTDAGGELYNAREALSICDVSPWQPGTVRSSDGQAELDLSERSAPEVGRIAIQEVQSQGPALAGWSPVAGPFRIFATFGEKLSRPALLHMQPGAPQAGPYLQPSYSIRRLDRSGKTWEEVDVTSSNDEPSVTTARITQLGSYALFQRDRGGKAQQEVR